MIDMKIILVMPLCLLLAACSGLPVPDLKRLYADTPDTESSRRTNDHDEFQNPVVLLHGMLGSRLRRADNHQVLWPGGLADMIFNDYQALALPFDAATLMPIDSGLEAYAITNSAAGRDYYAQIINTLHEAGGYELATPGQPAKSHERRYYVFVYDWRQDNVQSARRLNQFIEQIRKDYRDPKLRVDLVAHSMGGLIARYYLRYGSVDVLNNNDFPVNYHGASRVRRAVLVGTPNFGSASSLQFLPAGLLGDVL